MTQTKLNYFITIPGTAAPKSVKFSRFGSYNSKRVREWMSMVRDISKAEIASKRLRANQDIPVTISVCVWLPMPKATAKKRIPGLLDTFHTKKPDADNLLKPIIDGLTEADMWLDDNQVASMKIEKRLCVQGDQRAEVSIFW